MLTTCQRPFALLPDILARVAFWAAAIIACPIVALCAEAAGARPNIVVILADDLGYADLGCFGGEIETPNLDGLAAEGTQYTQFRGTPMCTTSRVALMAGMPFQAAGGGSYKRALPLPKLLKRSGYRTMMVGKWHAGTPDPRSRKLFDRSFGFLGGMTDSFDGGDDWFLDGEPYADFADGFYATTAFADRGVEFVQEAVRAERPFFLYAAFNAPHHPCQAPRSTVEKYRGRYRSGYAAIARQRRQRQIEEGVVDPAWKRAPACVEVRRWEELSEHRRDVEDARMAAYAAAVEEVDRGVGKLLDCLDQAGIANDTVVLFLSDNGGDYNNGSLRRDEKQIAWEAGGNPTSSNGWSFVKNTPFRYYKHSCHEGGLAVPLIVRWPDAIDRPAGVIDGSSRHITDLYPTLVGVAGASYPGGQGESGLLPLTGISLLDDLDGSSAKGRPPIFAWYTFSRAWIEGNWKAVSLYGGPWRLYDMAADRGETYDLADAYPDRVAAMAKAWKAFSFANGPAPEWPESEEQAGWGAHRLKMACPGLIDLAPRNSSVCDTTSVSVEMVFEKTIDFRDTEGRSIRLFRADDEQEPIWSADPDQTHPAQGKLSVKFNDLPTLKGDRSYFFLADPGWARVGGKPLLELNDGAFWWRFRTPANNRKDTTTHASLSAGGSVP